MNVGYFIKVSSSDQQRLLNSKHKLLVRGAAIGLNLHV